jgi:hypothetical protein
MEQSIYRFGEYKFAILRTTDLQKIPKVGWLVSLCPPDWAIAFYSPKFGKTKFKEWYFCSLIRRFPLLSLVMKKEPFEVLTSA